MFAVVRIAGQQFKVSVDSKVYVPAITGTEGESITFSDVLLVDNEGTVTVGSNVKATVTAEVIRHIQGDKVIAFKMKRRKGFRKKIGHRTHYTQIKVTAIA
jgi:large subunit ribosomal protein L21